MNDRIRQRRGTVCGLLALTMLLLNRADAQEPPDATTRARRIEFINTVAARHRLAPASSPSRPLELRKDPVMYWSNPIRGDVFGGVYVWTRNTRPVACAGVFVWFNESGDEFTREFHSLSDEPLTADYDDQRVWAPNRPGVEFRAIPGADPAAASRTARLRQIKQLAARFSATISRQDTGPVSLRRLATPIYRYQDSGAGVTDGAIVAFVQATDPEALLLIEARETPAGNRWHYALARCTAWAVTVQMDDDVVYDVPFYDFSGTDRSAPFYNAGRRPLTLDLGDDG